MASRLTTSSINWRPLSSVIVALLLPACASLGVPVTSVKEFCSLMESRLPIIMSRKDTEETKRQVAKLNAIYKERCRPSPTS